MEDYKYENGERPKTAYMYPVPGVEKTQSDNLNELFAALAKAQGEMEGAKKDAKNPFFKSNYADLSSCWDSVRGPLSKNGLSVTQLPQPTGNGVVIVKSVLGHSSGQWISSTIEMKPVKQDPQGIGSCLTYARRYGLMSLVGIAPEDDDGNAASTGNPGKQKPAVENPHITIDQATELNKLAKTAGFDQTGFKKWLKEHYKYMTVASVKKTDFADVKAAIEQWGDIPND